MMNKHFLKFSIAAVLIVTATTTLNSQVSVSKTNPHYLIYNNKPIILITSDHHYGAVIDLDFDYVKYLGYLADNGMNLTRIYPGRKIGRAHV